MSGDFHLQGPKLTERQLRVLQMVERLTFPRGPSCRELGAALGITYRGAHEHLRALAKKGVVDLARQGRSRGLTITKQGKDILR